MNITADFPTARANDRVSSSLSQIAGAIVILSLFWLEFVYHLKGEWSMNPQYSYGWCVPFLAAYLLYQRWEARPAPGPMNSRLWAIAVVVFSVLAFFPIRFIAEANPDWRLISWSLGLTVVAASLATSYLLGGTAWLRYFAFPVLFLLVAVPWPAQFEQTIVQGLMRTVTSINVALLNLTGTLAVQHGNVIEVSTGPIGIEEACSGIRSLQATFMISLFLGEFYEFSFRRRATLVTVGAILAFLCNLVRTALLVWIGAKKGTSSIGSWHDPAGWIILVVCLFGLWLASLWMKPRELEKRPLPKARGQLPHRLPLLLISFVTLWLLIVEASVSLWYRSHQPTQSRLWTVGWPQKELAYEQVRIDPEAEGMLRYNKGGGGVWNDNEGHRWNMYFFRWLPGQTAALFVRNHRPDICLPASGMTLRADEGLRLINVNNFELPIHSYRFDAGSEPLHVYYCYWDGRSTYSIADVNEDWTPAGRIKKVLQGKRDSGTQMLELAVFGFADDSQAREALLQQLNKIIRPG